MNANLHSSLSPTLGEGHLLSIGGIWLNNSGIGPKIHEVGQKNQNEAGLENLRFTLAKIISQAGAFVTFLNGEALPIKLYTALQSAR